MGRIEGTDRRRARAHVVADARDDEDERWGWTRDVHGGRCAGGDAERGGAGEPGGALRGETLHFSPAAARAPGQRCERVVIGQVFVSGGTGERGVWVVGDAVDDAGGEVSVRQGVLRFGEIGREVAQAALDRDGGRWTGVRGRVAGSRRRPSAREEEALACGGAAGEYLLGVICKERTAAAAWTSRALTADPLMWCAYEGL